MYKEQATIETTKKPETQENHEIPQSVESTEDLRQQMRNESEKETAHFKNECANDIAQTEVRAEKDGLLIDSEDKKTLQELGAEADVARKELEVEIGVGSESGEKMPTKEQQDAFEKGKEKVLSLQAEGNDNSPEYWALYSHLTEGLGKDMQWRNAGDIDVEKVNKMLASRFPEKDQIVTRACPKCGREYTGTDTSYCTCGGELELKDPKIDSEMKEKVVKKSDLLSEEEASKKFLAEERKKLAEEIRTQRRLQRDRFSALKAATEAVVNAQENIDTQQGDKQYAQFAEMQSAEANIIAERISSELNEKDAFDEQENIDQLIDSSEDISLLKKKIEEHYAKADEIARKQFDALNRSLEHVMLRNNVFLVHKFEEQEGDGFRHDENYSNVSTKTTYEDDLDIMLSLEPSISASSVIPGEKTKLWHGASGFLLGGGQIGEAGSSDIRTVAHGIKDRRSEKGEVASTEEIDEIVSRKGNSYMNELVVNNPEVFGFFQHAEIDKDGRCWALDMKTRSYSEEVPGYSDETDSSKLKSVVDNYKRRFAIARDRKIPLCVMTATREVYEYIGVNDDGTVEIGRRITPKEIATGRAGLPSEKRKEIGKRIVEKHIFTKQETNQEASEILGSI